MVATIQVTTVAFVIIIMSGLDVAVFAEAAVPTLRVIFMGIVGWRVTSEAAHLSGGKHGPATFALRLCNFAYRARQLVTCDILYTSL